MTVGCDRIILDSMITIEIDEYFEDVALAYRQELAELYSLGCRNIQIDDPLLAYFCAESMIQG